MAQTWNLNYDVLEPIKVPLNPHRDVGILIDISDEQDKHDDIKLSGSDLDNIKKAEFDLVDLYQNIYVTPQHVTKPEKATVAPQHYSEFFQKFVAGKKVDWSGNPTSIKDVPLNDITDEIDSKLKELPLVKDVKLINHIILNNHETLRVLKVPMINELKCETHDGMQKKVENPMGYNTIKACEIQNSNGNSLNAIEIGNVNKAKLLTGTSAVDGLLNNNITSVLEKPFKYIDMNKTCLQSPPIQNGIISQNFGTINVSKNQQSAGVKILQTVTLDKKTYKKQRQVRSEMEKLRYTKGPDLYEKSVVLPQIMKRIAEKDKALQEAAKLKRRLILNSSKQHSECPCQCPHKTASTKPLNETKMTKDTVQDKLMRASTTSKRKEPATNLISNKDPNVIVVLENCNHERLIAHRVHSAFEKYVRTGSYF